MTALAIYLRFLGTGEASCQEDGRHFRPNHHAQAAMHIEAALAQRQTPDNAWLLRKIYPWLPSHEAEFRHREPLTRIRDIAHRNDIPHALKQEIKHRLQNKLHRCAGPEDLKTSADILKRITESPNDYSSEFIEQFKIFHEELLEFFNASQLDKRLNILAEQLDQPQNPHIFAILTLKSQTHRSDTQQLELIKHVTELRKLISGQTTPEDSSLTQQRRLCDIALEEFSFVLLSDMANRLTQFADHNAWPVFLHSLIYAIDNARLSQIMAQECGILSAELNRWSKDFQANDEFQLLRLKASLERSKRLTEQYADKVLNLFPARVQSLGRALQVSEHAIEIFCENDIRANIIFQMAKLIQMGLDPIRTALKLPAWETVVPGTITGKLVQVTHIEALIHPSETVIVMLDRVTGDEEIPNHVGGLVITQAIPYLSHLAVRARQKQVPFVMANDQKQQTDLMPLQGKTIQLFATADQVKFQETSVPRTSSHEKIIHPAMTLPSVTLTEQIQLYPLSTATPAICGSKASNAGLLINYAEQSHGLFQAPQGMIMPFGIMEHCLAKQSELASEYARLQTKIIAAPPQALDPLLTKMRALIQQIAVPHPIIEQLTEFFGESTLLAVRSSANGEDLAQFAGAGLYDSVVGVTAQQSTTAIQQVWSSLWSRTATLSRKNAGIKHNQIHMAILFQEMIEPELAFIMHTSDPMHGTSNSAWVELAIGLGDTLASAWQPGSPYRIRCDRHTGQSQLLSCANFSFARHANQAQGSFSELINYTTVPFSTQPARLQSLAQPLAKIASYLESVFDYPQDVEGAIRHNSFYVLQARAQQGLS